jgi:hypothetical protein
MKARLMKHLSFYSLFLNTKNQLFQEIREIRSHSTIAFNKSVKIGIIRGK